MRASAHVPLLAGRSAQRLLQRHGGSLFMPHLPELSGFAAAPVVWFPLPLLHLFLVFLFFSFFFFWLRLFFLPALKLLLSFLCVSHGTCHYP